MRVLTSHQARLLDEETIASGTSGLTLMERAAAAVQREILELVSARASLASRIVVVAGTGNNGGDGFEVARLLSIALGAGRVETLLVGDKTRVRGDAEATLARLSKSFGPPRDVVSATDLSPVRQASLIVDAVFGTGLSRGVDASSLAGQAILAIRDAPAFVVAVDLPSGLDAASGEIPGPHTRAGLTVTFGYPKVAHTELPAAGACGRVVVAGIGLSALPPPGPEAVTAGDLVSVFPPRDPESHKGSFGTVGIAGGARGMAGAAGLAARAAHRAGAGKVTAVVEEESRVAVHSLSAESTVRAWGDGLAGFDAIVAGPGLGQSRDALAVLEEALAFSGPVLLDADALNLIAKEPLVLKGRRCRLLLTPHLGEAARLLGKETAWIRQNRTEAARELSCRFDAAVVLKGFRSLCASPVNLPLPVLAGNPGMATGGMGDALSGVCGALLARGLSPFWTAVAGAWLHGTAGDLALERRGGQSVVASEVIEMLPAALEEVSRCRVP